MQAYILFTLYVGMAVVSVYHALLYKRDPRSAMGWIMACVFIPFGGPLAYYLFGINRVRSRARGIRRRLFDVGYEIGRPITLPDQTTSGNIRDIGMRVTGRMASQGNDVEPLVGGTHAYPRMLDAIRGATERVLLSSYIFKPDADGMRFVEALQAAVERGVDVKVLVDGFGEKYSWRRISKVLKKHNVPVERFLPPRLIPPSVYLNLRNHRKILVVDNSVAFAGGMNIAVDNSDTADEPLRVADLQFELHGPVVTRLADLFYRDWQFATGQAAPPPQEPATGTGDMVCRLVPDSPDEELDTLALTVETVISAARQRVDIMTPYFLPTRELISSLQSAALRGVRVRIVMPEKNNLFFVHWANRNMLADLLRWGIEAYYQPPPFCHTKLLCIDDDYTLLGSANLDPRSLRLNFELGIEVFSPSLSSHLLEHFQSAVAASKPITFKELTGRGIFERLRDSVFALFSPYL